MPSSTVHAPSTLLDAVPKCDVIDSVCSVHLVNRIHVEGVKECLVFLEKF